MRHHHVQGIFIALEHLESAEHGHIGRDPEMACSAAVHIEIPDKTFVAPLGQSRRQMHGDGGLPYPPPSGSQRQLPVREAVYFLCP